MRRSAFDLPPVEHHTHHEVAGEGTEWAHCGRIVGGCMIVRGCVICGKFAGMAKADENRSLLYIHIYMCKTMMVRSNPETVVFLYPSGAVYMMWRPSRLLI